MADEINLGLRKVRKNEMKRTGKPVQRRKGYKRPELFIKEYLKMEREMKRQKVVESRLNNITLEATNRIAIVVRIREGLSITPKSQKIINTLKIRDLYSAILVRMDAKTVTMLQYVQPFVAYGYPNPKTIQELIYKRGFANVLGKRVPINDNILIENVLGKHGIICVEDIIHEIVHDDSNIEEVLKFVWPFKLSPPKSNFVKKLGDDVSEVKAGERDDINDLIQNMI